MAEGLGREGGGLESEDPDDVLFAMVSVDNFPLA